jgi:hypothetical protein
VQEIINWDLKLGFWMYQDNTQIYKAIYIPVYGPPEYLCSDLNSIFSFSKLSLESLMFAPLDNKLSMCIDSTYEQTNANINKLASQIYRDYIHVYSLSDLIYGPALMFSYIKDDIKNTEHLLPIEDKYVEEITNRYLSNEKFSI